MTYTTLPIIIIASLALSVSLSLFYIHHKIKNFYKGIDFWAAGVLVHVIGFIIYTGLFADNTNIVYYLGNGLFLLGMLSFYHGINLFIDHKTSYKRILSVLIVSTSMSLIYFYIFPNMLVRQVFMTLLILYLIFEILFIAVGLKKANDTRFARPIYIFSLTFILLLIARIILIAINKLDHYLPQMGMTYNSVIKLLGAVLFTMLGYMVAVIINARAIYDLQKEREMYEVVSVTDYLTKLPNRLALERYVKAAMKQGRHFALAFIDFDEFKKVNDKYGHLIGDRVIVEFAKTLMALQDENMFTARYGGDEFITVIRNYDSVESVKEVIKMYVQEIASNIQFDDVAITLSLSIGVSLYPEHSDNLEDLIGRADSALSIVKTKQKNSIHFFDESDSVFNK